MCNFKVIFLPLKTCVVDKLSLVGSKHWTHFKSVVINFICTKDILAREQLYFEKCRKLNYLYRFEFKVLYFSLIKWLKRIEFSYRERLCLQGRFKEGWQVPLNRGKSILFFFFLSFSHLPTHWNWAWNALVSGNERSYL